MRKLSEQDIEIDFSDAIEAFVFDQMDSEFPNYHGVDHMCRVDFIAEFENAIVFVELKDPSNPQADRKRVDKFMQKVNNGKLYESFAKKFIDTFLYRWAEEKVHKPIYYLGLVTLESELLTNFSDEVSKKIPPLGREVTRWKRKLFENCQVFNLDTWNENFPKWQARRISEGEGA